MRRFTQKIQATTITEPQESRPVRLKISTELGEKIRKASDQAKIPREKLVVASIRRGLEFLERAKS